MLCLYTNLIQKFLLIIIASLEIINGSPSGEAVSYLQKFGYLSNLGNTPNYSPGVDTGDTPSKPRNGSSESFIKAIKTFQEFAGLPLSGKLDEVTLEFMSLPRCGVKDFSVESTGNTSNYAVQGSRWGKNRLTFRVTEYSSTMSEVLIDSNVEKAFKFWSDVTNLEFVSKDVGEVDIDIGFFAFDHGDGDPFDGMGGTLAHAYFPRYGGDVHMDESEAWSMGSREGTNFLQTLTHEIGHSLGLSHSRVSASVMAPFYRGWDPNFKLHADDIQGIQSLYGKPRSTTSPPIVFPTTKVTPSTYPTTTSMPNLKELDCPSTNTNTQGREILDRIENVGSWSACALKCTERKSCRYWTWHHKEAVGFEFRCVLMADFSNKAEDSNTISGTSECKCPLKGINTQGRQNSRVIGLEPTWKACAIKCSMFGGCLYWTWHPDTALGFARRCVHMSGYTNLAEDSNTISGSKKCI